MFVRSSVGLVLSKQKNMLLTIKEHRLYLTVILLHVKHLLQTHWFITVFDATTNGPTSQPHEFSLHPSTLENHPTILFPPIPRSPDQTLKK